MAQALSNARQIAATYGITVESLQFYATRGLLQPVVISGVKYYTARDRIRIEIVLKGKRLGFSLAEIEKMVFASSSRPPPRADQQGPFELHRVVGELRTLLSERDDLDASIAELTALLSGK